MTSNATANNLTMSSEVNGDGLSLKGTVSNFGCGVAHNGRKIALVFPLALRKDASVEKKTKAVRRIFFLNKKGIQEPVDTAANRTDDGHSTQMHSADA